MKKLHMLPLYLLIVCFCLTMTACQKKEEKSPAPKDEFKTLEAPLQEMEAGLLAVMAEADLVPYYAQQIQAKKQKEEEQKQEAQTSGGGAQASTPPPKEEFKPEPVTLNDTLLTGIIKQETSEEDQKEKEVPDDLVFIWHGINSQISQLHEQWNGLKPKLSAVNVSETVLTDFGNALNNLTIAGTENKYTETLTSANAASGQFAGIMQASKDDTQPSLYLIKYYAREIVLSAATDGYPAARENFRALKSESETLSYKLVEKDAKDHADRLKAAVDDLENALELQDLNLLKVEASVITKNITEIKDQLEKQ